MSRSFSQIYDQISNRAHVYPPMELYQPISFAEVQRHWTSFTTSPSHYKFGLYVHLPFCQRKCSFCYCDTIISSELERFDLYLRALHKEIDLFSSILGKRRLDSLYLGGGTPTHIGAKRLDLLFAKIFSTFAASKDTFVNVEATPGSIDQEVAAVLQRYHTDRVTLGIQSVDEQLLNEMNRPQSFAEIEKATVLLREHSIDYLNFDLVGGLPNDTKASFLPQFSKLLDFNPDMVHIYPYSPRPGFPAAVEKEQIIAAAKELLQNQGYRSIKNDGWGRDEGSSNWQVRHKIEDGASCLGLGIRARSHIFGRLAYRSHFTKNYQDTLVSGGTPEYRGFPLKLRHQVQRYLIDNLRSGLNRRTFTQLFGGDINAYLQKYHSTLLPLLKMNQTEVQTGPSIQSNRALQQLIFDKQLLSKLYLQHINQQRRNDYECSPEAHLKVLVVVS